MLTQKMIQKMMLTQNMKTVMVMKKKVLILNTILKRRTGAMEVRRVKSMMRVMEERKVKPKMICRRLRLKRKRIRMKVTLPVRKIIPVKIMETHIERLLMISSKGTP